MARAKGERVLFKGLVDESAGAAGGIFFDVRGKDRLLFMPELASEKNRAYAEIHGWLARIGDKAAGMEGEDAYELLRETIAHFESGTDSWTFEARTAVLDSAILQAVAEMKGWNIARVRQLAMDSAKNRGCKPAQVVASWAGISKVAQRANEIRAEKAGLDSGEMEEELEKAK